MKYNWAVDQLMKLEKEPQLDLNQNFDSVTLVKPQAEKQIDDLFQDKFFPPISELFSKSVFQLAQDKDKIEGKIYSGILGFGKEYEIFIVDPQRPYKPGQINKLWFSKFTLLLSKHGFHFSTELRILLDEHLDDKLLRLLKNPYFDELPPVVSYSPGIDISYYSIKFDTGDGISWSWVDYNDAVEIILEKIKRNFSILLFLNENENKLYDDSIFQRLENHLVTYFENW